MCVDVCVCVGEHCSVALADVEEYCSALHVEEKAKRIQLVPEHCVAASLNRLQGMLIGVDGEVAIPSHAHAGARGRAGGRVHTHVKHKVVLVNELGR